MGRRRTDILAFGINSVSDAIVRLEYTPVDRRKPESIALQAFRRDVTSQSGEDGVIARTFELIGTTNMVCIEFGAAEGKALSNTWSLVNDHGWRGIFDRKPPWPLPGIAVQLHLLCACNVDQPPYRSR